MAEWQFDVNVVAWVIAATTSAICVLTVRHPPGATICVLTRRLRRRTVGPHRRSGLAAVGRRRRRWRTTC
eukprot:SAG11_NODE_2997_length_2781_cov_2.921700_2_plen_70_part_00